MGHVHRGTHKQVHAHVMGYKVTTSTDSSMHAHAKYANPKALLDMNDMDKFTDDPLLGKIVYFGCLRSGNRVKTQTDITTKRAKKNCAVNCPLSDVNTLADIDEFIENPLLLINCFYDGFNNPKGARALTDLNIKKDKKEFQDLPPLPGPPPYTPEARFDRACLYVLNRYTNEPSGRE